MVEGIERGLSSPKAGNDRDVEAAFYGGTFTNLPQEEQESMLDAAGVFLRRGRLSGLRISTRPDAIFPDRIDYLKKRGVTTIEIGAQSMDDAVLAASGRGHTAERTGEAARAVKQAGVRLGLQLLPGLPGENDASRWKTLEETGRIKPDLARLYPLLVIKDAPLERMYRNGMYRPLTLDKAVAVCSEFYRELTGIGVRVTRMGLHEDPTLVENVIAGPYHPAFGDLVLSEIYYQRLRQVLESAPLSETETVIYVAPADLSQAVGHRRANITRLSGRFRQNLKIKTDPELPRGRFLWQGGEYHIRNSRPCGFAR